MGADSFSAVIIQLAPFLIWQAAHAVVIFLCQRKWKRSPWLPVLLSLIPVLGLFVALVFYVRTLLRLIERVQALTEQQPAKAFD